MDIKNIETRDFSRLPSVAQRILGARRFELEQKLGQNIRFAEPLKDFRRCFEVGSDLMPVLRLREFNRLMHAISPQRVKRVEEFMPRTFERGFHTGEGEPGNPFSHIVTSMFFLRTEISALAQNSAEELFSSFREEGIDTRPFISLNDFSFMTSLFKRDLPALLEKDTMDNLFLKLRMTLSQGQIYDAVPFEPPQADLAAKVMQDFFAALKTKWQYSPPKEKKRIEGLNEISASLRTIKRKGIEFAFAPKNTDFFTLGDDAGDCTAFVRSNQIWNNQYRKMENVFYDVPMWLAMPSYQVLCGYFEGKFVIKFHILIVSILDRWTLLIDATETSPLVRDDVEKKDERLIEVRQKVFDEGIAFIRGMAKAMGNIPVLAEFFSNTDWVRERYLRLPMKAVHIPTQLNDGMLIDAAENFLRENSVETRELLRKYELPLHIQVKRTDISDQVVKPGYRILYILDGLLPDKKIPYRGV